MATRKVPTEHEEACILARYMDARGLVYAHIPNEGKRSFAAAARLRAEGMQPGIPDYLIFGPGLPDSVPGLALELKRTRGPGPTQLQREWLDRLESLGWRCIVARGAEQAIQWLREQGL